MERFYEIVYIVPVTKNQKLATETCPSFDATRNRALKDFYEIKPCKGVDCNNNGTCPVKVMYFPPIGRLEVKGSCPNE